MKLTTKLSDQERDQFFAYLDSLPEDERPIYAFLGRKSGLWHQLGGGTAQMLVLVYEDRMVISTRGMANAKKEKRRVEKAVSDVTEVHVITGPLFSSVQFKFNDGTKTKIANVGHGAGRAMESFGNHRLLGLDRDRLDRGSISEFWYACVMALPTFPRELVF